MKMKPAKFGGGLGFQIFDSRDERATLFKACCAELLGTALFVFFSTAVVTSGCHTSSVASDSGNAGDTSLKTAAAGSCFLSNTSTILNIALAFGITLFVVIYFTASFSGGHINPAVTFGMFLARRISLLRAVLYICVQCGGAAIASIILKGLDPTGYKAAGGASNQVSGSTGLSGGQALGFEIIGTFILVFTVFAATDPVRAKSTAPLGVLAPLAIGFIVIVDHLMLIPVDGCSVNPARSFGPAVVSRSFNHYWVFWAGPMAGALIASLLYEIGFRTYETVNAPEDHANSKADVESGIPVAPHDTTPVYSGVAGKLTDLMKQS